MLSLLGCLVLLVSLVAYGEPLHNFATVHKPLDAVEQAAPPTTLRFATCNGFANQRLSLVYGVILAKELNRTPVAPEFVLDGTQSTTAAVLSTVSNARPFQEVYDLPLLNRGLAPLNVRVLPASEAPSVER